MEGELGTRLLPARFDAARGAWAHEAATEATAATSKAPRTLVVATWNVWFGELGFSARAEALLDALAAVNADVICLQEVTAAFFALLLREPWVRADYHVSDGNAARFADYGTLILSRWPITTLRRYDLPTTMGRDLLVAQLALGSSPLFVANVHLESRSDSVALRAAQLGVAQPILRRLGDDVVWSGDFNFCSAYSDENARLESDFADAWPALRPGELGWTIDTDINRMRAANGNPKHVRFDRILVRAATGKWRAQAIRMLGTTPLIREPELFPSDHFGLCATLARQD